MFSNFLIIIGTCASMSGEAPITEWQCQPSTDQATLARYQRLVDCARDRAALPKEIEAYCFGEPFNPFDQRG